MRGRWQTWNLRNKSSCTWLNLMMSFIYPTGSLRSCITLCCGVCKCVRVFLSLIPVMLFGPKGKFSVTRYGWSLELESLFRQSEWSRQRCRLAAVAARGPKAVVHGCGLCHGCDSDCHATQPQDTVLWRLSSVAPPCCGTCFFAEAFQPR